MCPIPMFISLTHALIYLSYKWIVKSQEIENYKTDYGLRVVYTIPRVIGLTTQPCIIIYHAYIQTQ